MASSSSSSATAIALLATLLVLSLQTAPSLEDTVSPISDDVCKKVECGKGNCKPSLNTTFSFECECDPGWKQTRSHLDHHLKFLPCIIPNCTLNYSCSKAPSPVPSNTRSNESFFDPCYWSECGGGTCNKTSNFKYSCDCEEGYYNLLNSTTFPCFKDCALGMDCLQLGITVSNNSASPPALPTNGGIQAWSALQGNLPWLTILMLSLAMILCK